MIFASDTQLHIYVFSIQGGAFNQEKALIGAFSVIVKGSFPAPVNTVRVIAN